MVAAAAAAGGAGTVRESRSSSLSSLSVEPSESTGWKSASSTGWFSSGVDALVDKKYYLVKILCTERMTPCPEINGWIDTMAIYKFSGLHTTVQYWPVHKKKIDNWPQCLQQNYTKTAMWGPGKWGSVLSLHSRCPLIECVNAHILVCRDIDFCMPSQVVLTLEVPTLQVILYMFLAIFWAQHLWIINIQHVGILRT